MSELKRHLRERRSAIKRDVRPRSADAHCESASDRDVFSIRDLTREFAVSARTLRFYEEKGLLDPCRNGQERCYSRRDRTRLRYVLMGKSVGFTLEEVREMLDLYDIGDGQVTQLRVAIGKFRERIERLEQQRRDIDRAIAELTRDSDAMEMMLASREIKSGSEG